MTGDGRDSKDHGVVSHEEWLSARTAFLAKEKEFTRLRDEGCPSCSFWADIFNGIDVHLNHRDVTFVALSRAPLARIGPLKNLEWVQAWVRHHDGYED
jgi:predicted dithiol-disulfide oxidoreductase (DUF899 family)